MLSKHIQASCIDDAAGVRAMSCDCLASIPKAVYEQLPVSCLFRGGCLFYRLSNH